MFELKHQNRSVLHDRQFGAALVAAPVVWGLLFWMDHPPLDFGWVVERPFQYLALAIIYPVIEEIAFRGLIQGWLISRWDKMIAGFTYANLMTSLLFSLMHLWSHPALMAMAVIAPSIVFGHFRDKYHGWLFPSIALHCLYNAGYFLLYVPAE